MPLINPIGGGLLLLGTCCCFSMGQGLSDLELNHISDYQSLLNIYHITFHQIPLVSPFSLECPYSILQKMIIVFHHFPKSCHITFYMSFYWRAKCHCTMFGHVLRYTHRRYEDTEIGPILDRNHIIQYQLTKLQFTYGVSFSIRAARSLAKILVPLFCIRPSFHSHLIFQWHDIIKTWTQFPHHSFCEKLLVTVGFHSQMTSYARFSHFLCCWL